MFAFSLKLLELTRPYRVRLFLGVLAGVFAGLMEPLMIGTITAVFSVIFQPSPRAETANPLSNWNQWLDKAPAIQTWLTNVRISLGSGLKTHPGAAILLVCLIPCVMMLRGLFTYLNVYFLQWAAIQSVTRLRVQLFEHLINLSASFFGLNRSGELISRIVADTSALQSLLSNSVASIVKDPVTVVAMLTYLFWMEPRLTGIAMVVLPLCMIPVAVYSRRARRSGGEAQARLADLTQVMNEAFSGHRVVKAYNLESVISGQFIRTSRDFVGHSMRIVRSMEAPGPILEFIGSFGLALVFLYLRSRGGSDPDPARFLTVILAIYSLYRPMKNLARLHNQFVQARAATERIFELLATRNTVVEPKAPLLLHAAGAAIDFEDVGFSYGSSPLLREIRLSIQPGQLVALVGLSGSGKTTLANLLLRFYDPQQGRISIGGVDLREVSTRDLHNQMAVVTQETILFNDTIRRNIELGRPGATLEEVIAAARHAHAHEFIVERPNGYDTVIGDKGVLLSGGQRQRIAIARAVLKNAPILILDEATSALDSESERLVQAALEELMRGKTTLCIAHRLSTIRKADRVVVLQNGQIIEQGTHAELVSTGGAYRRLYELQSHEPAEKL